MCVSFLSVTSFVLVELMSVTNVADICRHELSFQSRTEQVIAEVIRYVILTVAFCVLFLCAFLHVMRTFLILERRKSNASLTTVSALLRSSAGGALAD